MGSSCPKSGPSCWRTGPGVGRSPHSGNSCRMKYDSKGSNGPWFSVSSIWVLWDLTCYPTTLWWVIPAENPSWKFKTQFGNSPPTRSHLWPWSSAHFFGIGQVGIFGSSSFRGWVSANGADFPHFHCCRCTNRKESWKSQPHGPPWPFTDKVNS